MGTVLTREQVERASRREGPEHPVVAVLKRYSEPLGRYNEGLPDLRALEPIPLGINSSSTKQ